MNTMSSTEIEKGPLIELAQFVLNRNTENIREELQEYLLEVALYNINKNATREEIKAAIEKEFSFSEFPSPILDLALGRMRNRLNSQGFPPRYTLSVGRRKALSEMFNNQQMLRDYFAARILSKIEIDRGEISDPASKEIIDCTFSFLAAAFNNLSMGISRIIAAQQENIKSIAETSEFTELLSKSFGAIKDRILREDAIRVVKYILGEYDEKTSLFLYSLAQSHTLMKILNVDPQCQSLEKNLILSDMTVYLDTNIVINLICERAQPTFHETCVKLMGLMKELRIRCVITTRTIKEVERHLKTSDEIYENLGGVTAERRDKLLNYVQDEIIKEYWILLGVNPWYKWPMFIGRLRNFSSILQRRYSIAVDKNVYDFSNDPKYKELSGLIADANRNKAPELVNHDCFHLLLIDNLRKETQGNIIPRRWFLTRDKSLSLVERMRMIYEKRKPSSVHVDVWLQMISPLLSPKMAAEEAAKIFTRCLSSDMLPSFPRVNPVLLTKLIGPCLDHTDLDVDEIKQIIGDNYLTEHFKEMGEKKVEVYLTNKLLEIREKRYKQESEKSEKEKAALVREIDRLKGDKEELIKEIGAEKHFGKYLAGGVVFLVVWVLMYYLILLPTIKDAFIACMVAILISLIFGFLVGFKRYDWILRRFMELFAAIAKR
jgi:hypothetical protein